ncbi:ABC transporter substrate-binding protein [Paenibacillus marchantiophytorum]|uniref:ABC transporter substrate-binding protein n=1 Tax=Paenibacillus marchantiophytorum TaxID=1619310 RepID=A0ABQ1EWF4_9BACL|nr:ABC transporter substrate-binding protein [Paenibacillus marchantiophytorum]GFZ90288.1 ABC transporter substrate-binding protein [Paenibacillus marchantiophytorum]
MNNRKRVGIALSTVLLLSIVVSACGTKSTETTKVRIGEVTRSIFYAPQYVALSQGFFKDEGLDVELTTTPGGDKTMTALLSNAIDVALVGSETSIYVSQQGSDDPVINFAQLTQTDGTFLVARKKADTFDWKALKGSVFLGQRKGGMPQMAGEFTLKKHNIDPKKDLELIQNIEFANIASAYSSGTGEYVQLFEPQASIVEKEGKGFVVASFGVESGHLPYTVYMTKQSFLKSNAATTQKFTNAIQRAQLWVASKSVDEITTAVLPYFKDIDVGIVKNVVKRYKDQGSFATDGIVDEQEWNNLLDVMASAGELKERVAWKTLVNNSFAEKARTTVKP